LLLKIDSNEKNVQAYVNILFSILVNIENHSGILELASKLIENYTFLLSNPAILLKVEEDLRRIEH
jgi:hypothetical protein